MGRKPKHSPSFFKILLNDDFTDILEIPPPFMKKHLQGKLLPEKYFLRTLESRKKWGVKIGKIGERYCFKLGWSEFVKANNLEAGDFLLFWLIRRSTFLVAIYDPSCCEKAPFNSPPTNPSFVQIARTGEYEKRNVKIEEVIDGVRKDVKTNNSCFEAVLTKSCKYKMSLPMKFVRATGILMTRKSTVLRDEEGRMWTVTVCLRSNGKGCDLTSGWGNFLKGNNVGKGVTMFFQFIPEEGNLIHVSLLDRKRCGGGRRRGATKKATA